eukprot:1374074-Alexandrium_andersonii.AAC.1
MAAGGCAVRSRAAYSSSRASTWAVRAASSEMSGSWKTPSFCSRTSSSALGPEVGGRSGCRYGARSGSKRSMALRSSFQQNQCPSSPQ